MTPDVNVLVAAFRADHPHHGTARVWLQETLAACANGGSLQLLPMVTAAFVRLVTNAGVFVDPAPVVSAIEFVEAMLAVPGCEWLELGGEWPQFAALCRAGSLGGNEVPDAWIAAAVRRHGAHLVTFDRDFARLLDRREVTLLAT